MIVCRHLSVAPNERRTTPPPSSALLPIAHPHCGRRQERTSIGDSNHRRRAFVFSARRIRMPCTAADTADNRSHNRWIGLPTARLHDRCHVTPRSARAAAVPANEMSDQLGQAAQAEANSAVSTGVFGLLKC